MTVDPNKILSLINQNIYIKDRESRYVWVNNQFASTAGLPISNIIGKTDSDLVWKGQSEFFRQDDLRVMDGISLINVERHQTRINGLNKIILNLIPYTSVKGEVEGVLGNFFDCSQHLVVQTKGTFSNNRFYLEFVPEWLSATELRVLFYLFHGFCVEKIAVKTRTSVSTVRYHIENIKTKMGCSAKSEIQEVAIRHGIFWKIFSLQHEIDE